MLSDFCWQTSYGVAYCSRVNGNILGNWYIIALNGFKSCVDTLDENIFCMINRYIIQSNY